MENRGIVTSDVDEEIIIIEGLELDLDVGGLHDLVDLAVLFAANKLAVFVGKLNLEANFVVESLRGPS